MTAVEVREPSPEEQNDLTHRLLMALVRRAGGAVTATADELDAMIGMSLSVEYRNEIFRMTVEFPPTVGPGSPKGTSES